MRKVVLALLLTACGTEDQESIEYRPQYNDTSTSDLLENVKIDPLLRQHVYDFVFTCDQHESTSSRCKRNLAKLDSVKTVESIDYGDSAVGVCITIESGFRFIQIESDGSYINSLAMKSLVFHELGHCLLDLEHSNVIDDIMYPILVDPERLLTRWHDLVDRLLSQEPGVYIYDGHSDRMGE